MESILKKLGALSGVVAEKQKQIEEGKKRPRRELEEQIAGAQKNFDTFTQLAESGDYASLRGIAFEMYTGILDDKLSVTEGNTPAISKKELDDLSAVLGQLDSFEQTVSSSGDKGLQKELAEMKEEVAVGMREYAGRIAARFNKLLENYKTQLEEFSDDPDMIAPVEVHEKSWETMAAEAKRYFIISKLVRRNDLGTEEVRQILNTNKEAEYLLSSEFDNVVQMLEKEKIPPEHRIAMLGVISGKNIFTNVMEMFSGEVQLSSALIARIKILEGLYGALQLPPRIDRLSPIYSFISTHPKYAEYFEMQKGVTLLSLASKVDMEDPEKSLLTPKERETLSKAWNGIFNFDGAAFEMVDELAYKGEVVRKLTGHGVEKAKSADSFRGPARIFAQEVITHTQNPRDLDYLIIKADKEGGAIKIENVEQATALTDKMRMRLADSMQNIKRDLEETRSEKSAINEKARLSEANLKTKHGELDSARKEINVLEQRRGDLLEQRSRLIADYERLKNDTQVQLSQLSQTVEARRKDAESAQRKLAQIKSLLNQTDPSSVGMLNAKSKYTELVAQLLEVLG